VCRAGELSVVFATELTAGTYEVWLYFTPHENRATHVRITITDAQGTQNISISERGPTTPERLTALSLGKYRFDGTATVRICNKGSDGYVVVDAIAFTQN